MTIGVHALVAPALVGLAVALIIVLIDPLRRCDSKPRRRLWFVWALLVAGGAAAIYLGVEGLELRYQLPMYLIGLFAIGVLILSAWAAQTRGRHIALITFAAFMVCGAALAVLRTAGRPMMEPIAVLLKEDRGLSGFHVATTDAHIYVATLSGEGDPADPFADSPIDRVIEIPRAEVVRRAARRPTKVGPDGSGRDEAQTLLLDLRARYVPAEAPAAPVTKDPVGDFAPLVNLHGEERYWPMGVERFLSQSTLYWRHAGGCPAWRAVDERHVSAPSEHPEKVVPKVEAKRLGLLAQQRGRRAEPYEHAPAGAACHDAQEPGFEATQPTRPFQRGRPKGLPPTEGFYLDASEAVREGAGRRRKVAGQAVFDRVPLYFEQNDESARRRRITYWLFYGYSLPPGPQSLLKHFAHEGDWERLSVLVERVRSRWRPLSVRFHFHDENRDVPWTAVRLAADEEQSAAKKPPTHPVAYIARNSHATYARAGLYRQRRAVGGNRSVSAVDEAIACADCPQWRTWTRLRNAKRQYWYGFGGAWGAAGADESRTGPLGPSQRKSVAPVEPSLDEATERRNAASED